MSWAKLDDQYTDHPKIVQVGPLGMALHVAALCYCARYLTDGFVPAAMIPRLISLDGIYTVTNTVSNGVTNTVTNAVTHEELTQKLVNAGLFDVAVGGYMVHDYLEYNPSSVKVKEERARTAQRQAEFKAKRESNAVSNGVSNGVTNSAPSPSPSPILKDIAPDGEPLQKPQKPPSREKPKSTKDPRTDHPAIKAIRAVTGKLPNKFNYDTIIDRLGNNPNVEKLTETFSVMTLRGNRPTNIDCLLDWYKDGIPPIPGKNNNGKYTQRSLDPIPAEVYA